MVWGKESRSGNRSGRIITGMGMGFLRIEVILVFFLKKGRFCFGYAVIFIYNIFLIVGFWVLKKNLL